MTESEAWAFLASPARPAILSTVRSDGRPHAAPVWYDVDGDSIVFTTGAETVKGRNLTRDPRVSVCVQDDQPPFTFVLVDGVAVTSDDGEQVRRWATHLGGRYMGTDRAEEYGIRNSPQGELFVRVIPTRLTGLKDVSN